MPNCGYELGYTPGVNRCWKCVAERHEETVTAHRVAHKTRPDYYRELCDAFVHRDVRYDAPTAHLVDASRAGRTQLQSGVDRSVDVGLRVHGRRLPVCRLPSRRWAFWHTAGLCLQHRHGRGDLFYVPIGESRDTPHHWRARCDDRAADSPAFLVS